jgi:hypothetical protein
VDTVEPHVVGVRSVEARAKSDEWRRRSRGAYSSPGPRVRSSHAYTNSDKHLGDSPRPS